MKAKEYNDIKWEDIFYLDSTSPSGLKRIKEVRTPRGGIRHLAGADVGCRAYTLNGKPYAWKLKMSKQAYSVHRVIWVLLHGSIDRDLVVDHLDGNPFNNSIDNLALKTIRHNNQNRAMYITNTSNHTGVCFRTRTDKHGERYSFWTAAWEENGKKRSKFFSVKKYGHDLGRDMAILTREKAIKLLNLGGQMYTDRCRDSSR